MVSVNGRVLMTSLASIALMAKLTNTDAAAQPHTECHRFQWRHRLMRVFVTLSKRLRVEASPWHQGGTSTVAALNLHVRMTDISTRVLQICPKLPKLLLRPTCGLSTAQHAAAHLTALQHLPVQYLDLLHTRPLEWEPPVNRAALWVPTFNFLSSVRPLP